MGLLNFSPTRCVRALSVNSICTQCGDVCPTGAVTITERLPAINQAQCVGCGGCVAVCPTEALKLEDFDGTEFFFSFAAEEENLVSCQKNVPCIAALSAEHLIGLCGLKQGLRLDTGHCGGCKIGEKVLEWALPAVENVNYLLEAIESPYSVECVALGYQDVSNESGQKDRRDFFKTFHLHQIGKIRSDFEKEIQKKTDEHVEFALGSADTQALRAKKITERRKLFFTALKRREKPETFHVVESAKIAFTSQKLMDETKCTACEMCHRVCPTAALTSDIRHSKIDFDPFLCVKCHLCHDVCETDAITLSPSYNLKEWFLPTVQNLITYAIRRCDECGIPFSSVAGEKICRRCRLEEEEARELWGI